MPSYQTALVARYLWCQGFVIETSPVNHWFLIVEHAKITSPSLNLFILLDLTFLLHAKAVKLHPGPTANLLKHKFVYDTCMVITTPLEQYMPLEKSLQRITNKDTLGNLM